MKILLLTALMTLTLSANDLIIKTSALSVDETIQKIENIVTKKGLTHFATIDHQAGAKKVGLEMPQEKVILFGNPKMGTKLMLKDPTAGLDLPMKILVYKDKDGNTKIAYHNPEKWREAYALKDCKLIEKMTGALDKISEKASH